jgi:hypothetical protein
VVYKGAMGWCMKSMVHYNEGMVYRWVVYGWGMGRGVWMVMGARWCNDRRGWCMDGGVWIGGWCMDVDVDGAVHWSEG